MDIPQSICSQAREKSRAKRAAAQVTSFLHGIMTVERFFSHNGTLFANSGTA